MHYNKDPPHHLCLFSHVNSYKPLLKHKTMNNNELVCFSLTIYNPAECSYTCVEYTDFHNVYQQALSNPHLIYQIEVSTDFVQPLFKVTNRIAFNIEVISIFDDYVKAKKHCRDTNGTLTEIPIAWTVGWKDLTDELQTDFFIEEFDNYRDAHACLMWAESYQVQDCMEVLPITPIFK